MDAATESSHDLPSYGDTRGSGTGGNHAIGPSPHAKRAFAQSHRRVRNRQARSRGAVSPLMGRRSHFANARAAGRTGPTHGPSGALTGETPCNFTFPRASWRP